MEENKNDYLLPSCTHLPLPSENLEDLIDKAKDWALMHGLSVRPITNVTKDIIQHAPITLLPSVFPRAEFKKACAIQTILNKLMHQVAHDYNFLKETLSEIIKVDDFTKRLFEIYETVISEGITQKVSLGLFRSDLMLESRCSKNSNKKPFCCWKQVEMNTMASGMGWLGPASTELHKFILNELGLRDSIINIPENKAIEGLCNGILEAWNIYNDPQAKILFLVEDFSYNISDQRFHEFEIKRQNPNVEVIRRTLTQLSNQAILGPNKQLLVNGKKIAVVYFRCGYEPKQYHTQKEWDVRLLIERSLAIKCPSIQYHLAGTKKVQQALADYKVVENYLKNEKTVACIKDIFTGLYSMSMDENGNAATEMALKYPERFVLKPQREGGGNNIYGSDIKKFLESMQKPHERTAWILMDRIIPPPQMNYLISSGNNIQFSKVISELGIFGVIIGDKDEIFFNKQVGHMFRTKLTSSNEGGLMSGTAFSDSPFLID